MRKAGDKLKQAFQKMSHRKKGGTKGTFTAAATKAGHPDTPAGRKAYANKVMNICLNLDKNSYIKNTELYDAVFADKVDLKNIAFLRPHELYKKKWDKFLEKKKNVTKKNLKMNY